MVLYLKNSFVELIPNHIWDICIDGTNAHKVTWRSIQIHFRWQVRRRYESSLSISLLNLLRCFFGALSFKRMNSIIQIYLGIIHWVNVKGSLYETFRLSLLVLCGWPSAFDHLIFRRFRINKLLQNSWDFKLLFVYHGCLLIKHRAKASEVMRCYMLKSKLVFLNDSWNLCGLLIGVICCCWDMLIVRV